MTTEQNRRIDDIRPAVGLDWDESAAKQARAAFEIPARWTILLTSSNHGLVGAYGHEFPHATSDHVKVNVVPESVASDLRARIVELKSSAAPASADNPSTAGAAKGGITFDESELRKLILHVSNTSHWCGRIGGDADEYEDALDKAVAADEALFNYVRSLAAPALNPSEVRDDALEEAAKHITQGNEQVRDNGWVDAANERARCAAAIRALKSAAIKAADQQGALGEKGGDV